MRKSIKNQSSSTELPVAYSVKIDVGNKIKRLPNHFANHYQKPFVLSIQNLNPFL